jgi:hypothetical protein
MDLEALSEREQIVMWYILRENLTEMLKSEDDEDNDMAGYVGRALADKLVYGEAPDK